MPGLTGYDLLEWLKASDLKHIPVVVLTGSESHDDVVRCYRAGANAYVVKPGSPERLRVLADTLNSMWFDLGRTP